MLKSIIAATIATVALATASSVILAQTPATDGARVYFIEPRDGAEISGPIVVRFGLAGMGVAPAGIEKAHTGHHHLLINTKLEDFANPIPADDNHLHFGGGQTETTVTLAPGRHTLQLVLGDHNHVPHTPPVMSEVISITVK